MYRAAPLASVIVSRNPCHFFSCGEGFQVQVLHYMHAQTRSTTHGRKQRRQNFLCVIQKENSLHQCNPVIQCHFKTLVHILLSWSTRYSITCGLLRSTLLCSPPFCVWHSSCGALMMVRSQSSVPFLVLKPTKSPRCYAQSSQLVHGAVQGVSNKSNWHDLLSMNEQRHQVGKTLQKRFKFLEYIIGCTRIPQHLCLGRHQWTFSAGIHQGVLTGTQRDCKLYPRKPCTHTLWGNMTYKKSNIDFWWPFSDKSCLQKRLKLCADDFEEGYAKAWGFLAATHPLQALLSQHRPTLIAQSAVRYIIYHGVSKHSDFIGFFCLPLCRWVCTSSCRDALQCVLPHWSRHYFFCMLPRYRLQRTSWILRPTRLTMVKKLLFFDFFDFSLHPLLASRILSRKMGFVEHHSWRRPFTKGKQIFHYLRWPFKEGLMASFSFSLQQSLVVCIENENTHDIHELLKEINGIDMPLFIFSGVSFTIAGKAIK